MQQSRFEHHDLINEVILQLGRHASVRSYRDQPLPVGTLEILVKAAQSASTSSNLQTYSIVAVETQETKERIAEITGFDHVRHAPLLLVFCPDLHRLEKVCERQGYPFKDRGMEMFMQAVVDSALAGENAAVAAESMGMGICMLGAIRNDPGQVAELLRLPSRTFALFGLTVGYPEKPARIKPRLPMDVVLHREAYSDDSLEAGLTKYDREIVAFGHYKNRQVKMGKDEAEMDPSKYGWSEHSARRMSKPHPQRTEMKRILESLGWEF